MYGALKHAPAFPLRGDAFDGMSAATRAALDRALAAPAGIILFTGPEGEGRDYALGTALERCPQAHVVGEIVNAADAREAVEAGMSGRLVIAGIDAPDAVSALARFRAIGMEPLMLAASLRAILAQRQLSRLCGHCRHPVQASASLCARLGFDAGAVLWEAAGCARCAGSGRAAAIGLFELVVVDGALRALIAAGGDSPVLASHAFRDRPNLGGVARAMVIEGLIAGEDAVRLGREVQSQ